MGFLVSPGVHVKEIDLTNIIPAVQTNIGAVAGPFEKGPVATVVNIGSEEMVSINKLVDIVEAIEEKDLYRQYIEGPLGVRGRNSNNDLIREKLGWDYEMTLEEGIKKTYDWIRWQISKQIYSEV